jgi:hypothetical protein
VKESVFRKFQQLQSFVFGQPWDRIFYVIFSPSLDITNFIPDRGKSVIDMNEINTFFFFFFLYRATDITIPFSSDRYINTYMIAMNIPSSQVKLFSSIGNAGFWNLASTTEVKSQFNSIAHSIATSYLNEYLFGFCSSARKDGVYTKYVVWCYSLRY